MPKNGPATAGKMMVAKIYPPDGKGPFRVFDRAARTYYTVWPDKIEEMGLVEGGTYAITYTIGDYNGKPQYTLTGAQPIGVPSAPQSAPHAPQFGNREIDIPVQAIVKGNAELALALANGDVARAVKILRTARLAWLEYLKPVPSTAPQPVPQNAPPEYDDEIPY